MSDTTPEQRRALFAIADAVVCAVEAAGSDGAPAGVLYAALTTVGFTIDQFNGLITGLVEVGKLRRSGDLLFTPGA